MRRARIIRNGCIFANVSIRLEMIRIMRLRSVRFDSETFNHSQAINKQLSSEGKQVERFWQDVQSKYDIRFFKKCHPGNYDVILTQKNDGHMINSVQESVIYRGRELMRNSSFSEFQICMLKVTVSLTCLLTIASRHKTDNVRHQGQLHEEVLALRR